MPRLTDEQLNDSINQIANNLSDIGLVTSTLNTIRDSYIEAETSINELNESLSKTKSDYDSLKERHLEMFMSYGSPERENQTNPERVKEDQNSDVERDSKPTTYQDLFKKREG